MDKLDLLIDILTFTPQDIKVCAVHMHGMNAEDLTLLVNKLNKLGDAAKDAKKQAILKEEMKG